MHSKKNIALLLDSRAVGGIETHVLELAIALQQQQQMVTIVFWQDYGSHPMEKMAKDAQIEVVKLNGSFISLLLFLWRAQIQVLHTHGYKANVMGRFACLASSCRSVATFHNGDTGAGKLRAYTWLDQASAVLSRNIAVNTQIANRVKYRTQVIANFVRLPTVNVMRGSRTHIAFAGRLVPEKGGVVFAELTTRWPARRFAVFGAGAEQETMCEISGSNTLYLGQVRTLEPYWSGIDVLVISSFTEGLPMVALEAMSHGVPVIATRVGALPQLIEPGVNGYLADISVDSLDQCLQTYFSLNAEQRHNMRAAAIATINSRYSSKTVIHDILEVYA